MVLGVLETVGFWFHPVLAVCRGVKKWCFWEIVADGVFGVVSSKNLVAVKKSTSSGGVCVFEKGMEFT